MQKLAFLQLNSQVPIPPAFALQSLLKQEISLMSGALSLHLVMYPFLIDSDDKFSCDSRVRCALFIHWPLWHKCDTSNCLPSAST